MPAFEALAAAVEAGDDETAERTLTAILARGPEGDTLERAEAFERILRGRRLGRALELRLHARADPEDERQVVLVLEGRHGLPEPLGVRSLPGRLEVLWTGVDATGLEQRAARSLGVDAVTRFDVEPGQELSLPLGRFPVGTGTGLAVRASFELEFPGCELEQAGQLFPVNRLAVEPTSLTRLAAFLPNEPVEPSELVRYLEAGGDFTAATLERAVRIAPERRGEALDLLAQAAQRMPRQELERALPALRWLSGNRHLGADVEAWRRWLEARPSPFGVSESADQSSPRIR